jgi:hypothetical protein
LTAPLRAIDSKLRMVLLLAKTIANYFWVPALGGALFGLALIVAAILSATGWMAALSILAGAVLAFLGACICVLLAVVSKARRIIPDNKYGLCTGLSGKGFTQPALTPWLADLLDEIADKNDPEKPLTFGDLSQKKIDLVLLTTNLTHGAPYQLPFDTRIFYYSPDEFREFFPERIVDWMERNAPEPTDKEQENDWDRLLPLRPLPEPANLPVIVAVRMSLSFPILLSAIPLWAIDYRSDPDSIRYNWFSDGGICSNFPLHFFDSPIPTRPTFGINLRPTERLEKEECDNVAIGDVRSGIIPRWTRFAGVLGFLNAIFDTMQNWTDNALLRVPGYRDRVAHINHASYEGGLNLDMPKKVIEAMVERGRCAGGKLVQEFEWVNHRWTRYRSTMGVMEEFMEKLRRGYETASLEPPYPALIERTENEPKTSYMTDWTAPMRSFAKGVTTQIIDLAKTWTDADKSFRTAAGPDPKPILRIAPDV